MRTIITLLPIFLSLILIHSCKEPSIPSQDLTFIKYKVGSQFELLEGLELDSTFTFYLLIDTNLWNDDAYPLFSRVSYCNDVVIMNQIKDELSVTFTGSDLGTPQIWFGVMKNGIEIYSGGLRSFSTLAGEGFQNSDHGWVELIEGRSLNKYITYFSPPLFTDSIYAKLERIGQ